MTITYEKTNKRNILGNNEVLYEEVHTKQIIAKKYITIEQLEEEKLELQDKIKEIDSKLTKMRAIK